MYSTSTYPVYMIVIKHWQRCLGLRYSSRLHVAYLMETQLIFISIVICCNDDYVFIIFNLITMIWIWYPSCDVRTSNFLGLTKLMHIEFGSYKVWVIAPHTLNRRSSHLYGGNLIDQISRKQTIVSRSSKKFEYNCVANATAQPIWI